MRPDDVVERIYATVSVRPTGRHERVVPEEIESLVIVTLDIRLGDLQLLPISARVSIAYGNSETHMLRSVLELSLQPQCTRVPAHLRAGWQEGQCTDLLKLSLEESA